MAAGIVLATGGAALSLNGVLRGWTWYLPLLTTIVVVSAVMAMLRALRARPLLVMVGGVAALAAILTMTFFPSTAFAGFVPTGETLSQLGGSLQRASETVLAETTPVAPNPGIVLVACAAVGILVILMDALAVPLGMPAVSGITVLAILMVPAILKPESAGWPAFVLGAAGYLLVLSCSQSLDAGSKVAGDTIRSPDQPRLAVLTGTAALAASLVLPMAVPGFDRGTFPQGSRLNVWGVGSGLNPLITLGNSLRAPSGSGRITYATTAARPPYLRTVTIEDFSGESWGPADRAEGRRFGISELRHATPEPGGQQLSITDIDSGSFSSPYLPVPYAPESVDGLKGRWDWDPLTLAIRSSESTTFGQKYSVVSTMPELSAAALAQSDRQPEGLPEEFTSVPAGVPGIVRSTADSVAGHTSNPFAKALAIQGFLRSGDFTYSLETPAREGYDRNGMSVLADFLSRKSGYCIHFSAAMAVMARVQGIPSRIAIGYAPGRLTGKSMTVAGMKDVPQYEVDDRDAHAWPELYFEGLGWVPFEPTPSRGLLPSYATSSLAASGLPQLTDNDGALAAPTAAAPVPTPSTSAGPPLSEGSRTTSAEESIRDSWLAALAVAAGVLLLGAAPRAARGALRSSRLRAGRYGPAAATTAAWNELRDLGRDYGVPPQLHETPRNYSSRLRCSGALGEPEGGNDAAHQAVLVLTREYEATTYGRPHPDSQAMAAGTEGAGKASSSDAVRQTARNIAVVQDTLRANAGKVAGLRAEWVPPSILRKLGHLAAARLSGTAAVDPPAPRDTLRAGQGRRQGHPPRRQD